MDSHDRNNYVHLSDLEWEALGRMSGAVGVDTVAAMLAHTNTDI